MFLPTYRNKVRKSFAGLPAPGMRRGADQASIIRPLEIVAGRGDANPRQPLVCYTDQVSAACLPDHERGPSLCLAVRRSALSSPGFQSGTDITVIAL